MSAELTFSRPIGEPSLARDVRRAGGVYYTPPEVVSLVLDCVFDCFRGSGRAPRILDPACGAGEFLVQALERLRRTIGPALARAAVFGIDIDAQAVTQARTRLTAIDAAFPVGQIQVGDTLAGNPLAAASFDLIVGNPPYISIRQLSKSCPDSEIAKLRARYRTATGNFDLYALFIERALELVRPGGACGLVVPNKWATLDYARACRELLLAETTIEHVIDLSACKMFVRASVYPHIVVFQKRSPPREHSIQVRDGNGSAPRYVLQRSLKPEAMLFHAGLNVEAHRPTIPLAKVAKLACGTAGYVASRVAQQLRDAPSDPSPGDAEFITTSNIDRYHVRLGNVRFLSRMYVRPRLALDTPLLSPSKRRLFSEPKIVIAGMSRRLEAAWDERGMALGVQVFAARDFSVDPFYLLAILNSKLLSYLFATRFSGKRLSGGYLAFNKGQLAQLPIRQCSSHMDNEIARELAGLARVWSPAMDERIDQLVYGLYGLSGAEVDGVEEHFCLGRAAA